MLLPDLVYPCPICGDKLDIRIGKRKKPYFICDSCGVQLFVRKSNGIKKLAEKLNIELNVGIPTENKERNIIQNFAQLNHLIPKISLLNKLISEIEKNEILFLGDRDTEKRKKELYLELEKAENELKRLIKNIDFPLFWL